MLFARVVGSGSPTIVLLHGLGADEEDLLPLAEDLGPGTYHFLRAPLVNDFGGYSWYRIDFETGVIRYSAEDALASRDAVIKYIEGLLNFSTHLREVELSPSPREGEVREQSERGGGRNSSPCLQGEVAAERSEDDGGGPGHNSQNRPPSPSLHSGTPPCEQGGEFPSPGNLEKVPRLAETDEGDKRNLADPLTPAPSPPGGEGAILGGFSQGAIISTGVALARPDLVSGLILWSGRLNHEFVPEEPAQLDTPVLQQHGTFDPVLPITMGRELAEFWSRTTSRHTYQEFPMAHQISGASLEQTRRWLSELVQGADDLDHR